MTELPDYLKSGPQLPRMAEDLGATLGVASPPYVSIMGSKFTLIDGDMEEPITTYEPTLQSVVLDCVIIDANRVMSKIYYDRKYDPASNHYEPPTCWSDNGQAPSNQVATPQANSCAACPKGAWGSKTSEQTGKEVKACADYQKLALMRPGDDTVFLLRVPPNSLKHLRSYNEKFKGQPVDIRDVMTRIWFVSGSVGQLQFRALGWPTKEAVEQRNAILTAKRTDSIVGRLDVPKTPSLAAPVTTQIAPATQQTLPATVPQGYTPAPPPAQEVLPPQTQAPVAQTQPAAPVAQPGAPAQPAGRKPRTRRTAAAETPAPQTQAAPNPAIATPPPPVQTVQPPAQQPAAPPAQPETFGMSPATPPDPGLASGLDGLFGGPA